MYFRGVMGLLFGGLFGIGQFALFGSTLIFTIYVLLNTIGLVVAAYGIANEKKWGYQLGVAAAFAPFLLYLQIMFDEGLFDAIFWQPISLIFDIALVALLLHPMSANYQKVWFR